MAAFSGEFDCGRYIVKLTLRPKAFTPSEMVEIANDIEPLQMLELRSDNLQARAKMAAVAAARRKTLQEIPPRFHGRLRRWTGSPG